MKTEMTDAERDLFLQEVEALAAEGTPTGAAVVKDDREADYLVKLILRNEREAERLYKIAETQIEEINEKRWAIQRELSSKNEFLKRRLEEYFERLDEKVTTLTQSSYRLLSGKLIKKKMNPEYIRSDPDIIAFCQDDQDKAGFLKISTSLRWEELKKNVKVIDGKCYLSETGEEVPGINVVERPPVFIVKEG